MKDWAKTKDVQKFVNNGKPVAEKYAGNKIAEDFIIILATIVSFLLEILESIIFLLTRDFMVLR